MTGDRRAIGARLMAWGERQTDWILIQAHRMADQPLQKRQIRGQRRAIGIGPMQPGLKAALAFTGQG